ncbi:MAG TPA: class E sortase [Actinomycetota bacterium]|jgi:sortase A|nr:class E sortase [Actinomycetota bacterium]
MTATGEILREEEDAGRPPIGWRPVVRWFGIACLVVASGVGGYIGWLLWGTGLETKAAQKTLRADFVPTIGTRSPGQATTDVALPGDAYAEIVIPRIALDMIVIEGTEPADLKSGPGHYSDTADPWQEHGRVGIAGHRTTYLSPFWNLQQLRAGDPITLRTAYGEFEYRVDRVFVVPASGSGVVLDQTIRPTLVLTTCHPRFSDSQRLIVTADRVPV